MKSARNSCDMGLINLLSEEVANAIAAGEVIERPTSVVKELIENSLDAAASQIVIELKRAGRDYIRVSDDGNGIGEEDLELAFTRFATSKIKALEDIYNVGSLGFRGEALASIAAVSKVLCKSSDGDSGGSIYIEGGKVIEAGKWLGSRGTAIEVRDLFFNAPARLKFLRADTTEKSLTLRTVFEHAVAFPHVGFVLIIGGRKVLDVPNGQTLGQRIASLFGNDIREEVIPIEWVHHNIEVYGFVGHPSLSRSSRSYQYIIVNGRPVQDRLITKAVEQAYTGRIGTSSYPVFFVSVKLDSADVDVNIHPTKREIRFRHPTVVFQVVQEAVMRALSYISTSVDYIHNVHIMPQVSDAAEQKTFDLPNLLSTFSKRNLSAEQTNGEKGVIVPIGQYAKGFLIASVDEELWIVDQHAAHERILYNRILEDLAKGTLPSQALLIPVYLDHAYGFDEDVKQVLAQFGFKFEEYGPLSWKISAVPSGLNAERVRNFFEDAVEAARNGPGSQSALYHRLAASLACHSAIRLGDQISVAEQEKLIVDLIAANESGSCPHGRPTVFKILQHELLRYFKRI